MEWLKCTTSDNNGEKLNFTLSSEDTVNVNITSTLIELYNLVKNNWTQDYYQRER